MLLPWRPWDTRELVDSAPASSEPDLSGITVLIPARNEAEAIGATLSGLKTQGHDLAIVVVDDRSSDETVAVVEAIGGQNLRILSGEPLPPGWSGKLWALQQGFRHSV
jgi:glycosyltransferase involved in cell wall biosynthesis